MRFIAAALLLLCLTACTEVELASHLSKQVVPPAPKSVGTFKVGSPYKIAGKRYYPKESYDLVQTGIASWYGPNFHGKKTANGEIFNRYELTAAHKTLQMPSLLRVTNLGNGRSLIVRVNDRGPYAHGRILDLSERAAELLGFKHAGTAKIRLEVLKEESLQIAQAAKNGQSTNGYEVAMNRDGRLPTIARANVDDYGDQATRHAQPVSQASISAPQDAEIHREVLLTDGRAVPGHERNGNFYPDEVVTEMPVGQENIYVQAGSFSMKSNADKLASGLRQYGQVAIQDIIIDGMSYYRVRLGPLPNVQQADIALAKVMNAGQKNAIIVVD